MKTKRKPVSAGEMLREEFLEPLGMSRAQLAELSGLPLATIHGICEDTVPIDQESAKKIAAALGNSAQFWINTQRRSA